MSDKERYLDLVNSIEREGAKEIAEYIQTTDFFEAPASTKYHLNVKGGLCKHSLHVYDSMMKLRDTYCPDIPEDTVKITALFHDLAKVNFYEEYAQNKKEYSPNGSKRDEIGKFDWVSVMSYKVKDAADKGIIFGEHGTNSFIMVNKYMKLTDGETAAIINHHLGMDNGYAFGDMNEAMNRYPTLTLLHTADLLSTYIDENPYVVEDEQNN